MPRIPFQITQQDIQSLAAMLRERLQTGKSLVYYASGREVKKAYYDLPYDHIVLVDYNFRSTFAVRGNVIIVGMTALQATATFIKAGVKFDAFVCINEGLSEGGGYYPINGNWSMGTILPVLKDTYLHIACPGYYGRTRWREKLFNLPHQATLLDTTNREYLDPAIFSSYSRFAEKGGVWRVTKQPGKAVSFKAGNRTITLQRKNIWDDYEKLDQLLVRCTPQEAKNLHQLGPKAQAHWRTNYESRRCDYESNFEHILHYCNLHGIKKLGLTPWLGGNYNRFIDYLKANEGRCPYPQELYFYHLHHNDYQQLYQQAGETNKPVRAAIELP